MNRIPKDVIRRLPVYLRKLYDLYDQGEKTVSSGQLCRQVGLEPSQFRRDMALFGDYQRQTLYYDVDEMRHEIGKILGTYEEFSAIVIGAGKLGSLLLENFEFIVENYNVLGAFDVSPDMVGKEIKGVTVYHMDTLADFLRANKVDIAILTVPRGPAQKIAGILAENGVEAIWNFTNIDLDVGPDVLVENVHFSDSILALNYFLAQKKAGETD